MPRLVSASTTRETGPLSPPSCFQSVARPAISARRASFVTDVSNRPCAVTGTQVRRPISTAVKPAGGRQCRGRRWRRSRRARSRRRRSRESRRSRRAGSAASSSAGRPGCGVDDGRGALGGWRAAPGPTVSTRGTVVGGAVGITTSVGEELAVAVATSAGAFDGRGRRGWRQGSDGRSGGRRGRPVATSPAPTGRRAGGARAGRRREQAPAPRPSQH